MESLGMVAVSRATIWGFKQRLWRLRGLWVRGLVIESLGMVEVLYNNYAVNNITQSK